MKIAIVGAGAMGSLFGSMLADAGNEVWLCDIWTEHINAVTQNGLRIESQAKTRRLNINATTDPNRIGDSKLVLIFVKSTQTQSAAAIAAELAGHNGLVMTLQNGMGNTDILANSIQPTRILAGTTAHGATMLGPGNIRHAGTGPTTIGMWAGDDHEHKIAQQIADFFTHSGIKTTAVRDVRAVIWHKLFINVGINAITALTGIKNGQILDLQVTQELSRLAVEEAVAVAQAQGIKIHKDPVANVFKVAEATALNRSSMGQDVDHRRPTEIGAINGFIVREGAKQGLNVPVNQTLTALVETLEYHY
jgi:2-dehydropantoate 2-reductase